MIVWSAEGFPAADALPKGAMFDTDHHHEDILSEILRICPAGSNRRRSVHADDAGLHISKRTREFTDKNSYLRAACILFSHLIWPVPDSFCPVTLKISCRGPSLWTRTTFFQKSARFSLEYQAKY
jgi:hypothetical protein